MSSKPNSTSLIWARPCDISTMASDRVRVNFTGRFRSPGQHGREVQLRVQHDLVAETPADVGGDHPALVLADTEELADLGPQEVRGLHAAPQA